MAAAAGFRSRFASSGYGGIGGGNMLERSSLFGGSSHSDITRDEYFAALNAGESGQEIYDSASPELRQQIHMWQQEYNQGAGRDLTGERAGAEAMLGAYDENLADINASEERAISLADPFAEFRSDYAARINDAYENPDSLNLPGMEFAQKYGEQAIRRNAAAAGKSMSGNLYFDLMDYNQGLAYQFYGDEMDRLGKLAGVEGNQATATSANIAMGAAGSRGRERLGRAGATGMAAELDESLYSQTPIGINYRDMRTPGTSTYRMIPQYEKDGPVDSRGRALPTGYTRSG